MPDVFVAKDSEKVKSNLLASEEDKSTKAEESLVEQKKPHFHNPLKAYVYKPHWVNFETKHKEEKVEIMVRKHPVTNIPWILIALALLFIPYIMVSFPVLTALPSSYQTFVFIAWYMIVFAYALENFLVWFFNVGIVTNKRLVDIDFHNLLIKEVSDAEIDLIQDVTYKMNGAVRAIFNYGDVFIQTAGEEPNIEFLAVPKPDKIVKVLQGLREHHG